MTNGDRVRSMTDEELAQLIPSGDCFCCPINAARPAAFHSCEECALAWLTDEEEV